MVDVVTEIEIARPRQQVAEYAADPSRAPEWYENIGAVEWQTAPPVGLGSHITFVAHFLGRRLAYTYEVVEYVPVAQAGGTGSALRLDPSGAFEQEFLAAPRAERDAGSRCRLPLDGTPNLDFSRAELRLDAGDGMSSPLPYVEDQLGCADSPRGWFYDTLPDAAEPSALELCPNVCELVKTAPDAGLSLQIACSDG